MSDNVQGRTLARSSRIKHPSGLTLETPRLVPSFSSKGFAMIRGGESEVSVALKVSSDWLADSMLVSAYDMHYRYIPMPEGLDSMPEFTIVDSGGYEASVDHDLSTAVGNPHDPQEWSVEQLTTVLDSWPERFAAIFVSYDHPKRRIPVAEQVEEARSLFWHYRKQMNNFLLKPETASQDYLEKAINTVLTDAAVLRGFDIIGVTEKELGPSILDRMHNIARLRRGLDEAGIQSPIQVFGALDPVSSPMYYLAGAELFDGLTWLRYAYRDGFCVYHSNYGALAEALGIATRDKTARAKAIVDNVGYLRNLEISMRNFALDGDYRHFKYHRDAFERAFSSLRSKFRGGL